LEIRLDTIDMLVVLVASYWVFKLIGTMVISKFNHPRRVNCIIRAFIFLTAISSDIANNGFIENTILHIIFIIVYLCCFSVIQFYLKQ
jgi:hypothetical protein